MRRCDREGGIRERGIDTVNDEVAGPARAAAEFAQDTP
jgi:hypothetical protein